MHIFSAQVYSFVSDKRLLLQKRDNIKQYGKTSWRVKT